MKKSFFPIILPVLLIYGCSVGNKEGSDLPNIIYILADDLGTGDLSCYNPESKIHTPAIDKLAREGMLFSDAHSPSSVCTPTRYGILTGRYAWRTRLEKGVTWSHDTALVDPTRLTVAGLLKKKNYQTACIGKWHLGFNWAKDSSGGYDYFQPITKGPLENGFDYFFGITASLDIPPYFYIENDRITAHSADSIGPMEGKKFWRASVIGNDFQHEQVLPLITDKALNYIQKANGKKDPFFLYFPLPAPHTPILPTEEFRGKSGINEYADFVIMVDDVVRQIMEKLDGLGISENTLLVFTSDNGCSPMADLKELAGKGHFPSREFRGHKADIYEGGHRVPFIVRWPSRVKENQVSDQTMCLTDLMATVAGITGQTLPDHAGEDSYDFSPVWLHNVSGEPVREAIVHHSIDGCFAIRQGEWKLCFCPGSGGWSFPTAQALDTLDLPAMQLFNLHEDPSELQNRMEEKEEVVAYLSSLMQQYIERGRSTEGETQKNDRRIEEVWEKKE